MCGIVGMAGDLSIKDREIFEDMLDVCQLRGRDSTGAIRVNRQGSEYTYAKRVGPPAYLKDSREFENKIRTAGTSILVGHCRHKTVGDLNVASAHPFDIEEHGIIGVHNGTLKNYYQYPEHKHGKVDSLVLYERVGNLGAEEAFATAEGAYACVWWDQNTGRLCFIRNNERSLYVTYSKDKRKMYWASEPWMFGSVYRKDELWDGGEAGKVYILLEENVLYQVEVNANAPNNKPVFKVMEGKKIEKKSPVPFTRPYGNDHWKTHNQAAKTTVRTLASSADEGKGGEVTSPFLNDELPHHLTVPAKQPSETTSNGTTSKSNETSTTPSKASADQSPLLTSTALSSKQTNSLVPISSQPSQKTSREKLSIVSNEPQKSGSNTKEIDAGKIYQANIGTDIRYIRAVDKEYITDRRTGREVDEERFHRETGGCCCHCFTPINSLKEVAEIFDKGKRFICQTCVTPKAEPPVPAVVKEVA